MDDAHRESHGALAELALGIADARERAQAVAHLDACAECRAELAALSEVADELLVLVPPGEPPAGFESKVMAAVAPGLASARTARRRLPRRAAAALVAAALVALGGGGGLVADHLSAPARPGTRTVETATLRTGDRQIGRVVVVRGGRPWMSLDVTSDIGSATVQCQVVSSKGPPVTVGTFAITSGYGYWVTSLPWGITVESARLVLPNGHVLATATLTPST